MEPTRDNHYQDLSRRQWFRQAAAILVSCSTLSLLSLSSQPAVAASQARIMHQPGLEYLEPIYELQLSVEALRNGVDKPQAWPGITARLEKFFGGGLFSERNYYAGLNVQYMNQIEYETGELNEYIRLDKEERFNTMEEALVSTEALYKELKKNNPDQAVVRESADAAASAMNRWMELVPAQNRQAVSDLYLAARQADEDRNGKLDDAELQTMLEQDRVLWKKRIKLVGG